MALLPQRKRLKLYNAPSATRKESVHPRSLASTRTLAWARAAPIPRTDLVALGELDLSPRVAYRRARTRWPLHATSGARRRSSVGTRDRVACAQVLPGACVRWLTRNAALNRSSPCLGTSDYSTPEEGAVPQVFLSAIRAAPGDGARMRDGALGGKAGIECCSTPTLAQHFHPHSRQDVQRCT